MKMGPSTIRDKFITAFTAKDAAVSFPTAEESQSPMITKIAATMRTEKHGVIGAKPQAGFPLTFDIIYQT
ncbi:hypothetical protein DRQ25_01725 [Candidatus Fermentibacteria bacterium]|nr:MAG: hypothetical protein DRQ25_01725 [Candidatus Fermentibacteria bacterium]